VMETLAQVTDLFLFDVKFADPADHKRYTGVDNRVILENLRRLAGAGHEIHVRVPCITGVNDSPDQIRAVAQIVAEAGLSQIVLLPYNSAAGAKYEWLDCEFALPDTARQSDAALTALADVCRDCGLQVQIGG
jgi:pyruvate formate lyase activating enzyme